MHNLSVHIWIKYFNLQTTLLMMCFQKKTSWNCSKKLPLGDHFGPTLHHSSLLHYIEMKISTALLWGDSQCSVWRIVNCTFLTFRFNIVAIKHGLLIRIWWSYLTGLITSKRYINKLSIMHIISHITIVGRLGDEG